MIDANLSTSSTTSPTAAPAEGEVELTLVLPLRGKTSVSRDDFYDYWLNAHVTLPARSPGIDTIWLHAISTDRPPWPELPGVSGRPDPGDEIYGIPEATFPTLDDLGLFQNDSQLQMDDGVNFLAEQIAYRSVGANSRTALDLTNDPAPNGDDQLLRHMVFLRRRDEVSVADFRQFVTDTLVPAWAASPDLVKLRQHLFEEVEVTLDHPGVAMSKPLSRQYQAAVEVVMADAAARNRFTSSPAWTDIADALAAQCVAVHPLGVDRCITTKYRGQVTVAGVRGVTTADVIRRLDANNQTAEAVTNLFMSRPLPMYE